MMNHNITNVKRIYTLQYILCVTMKIYIAVGFLVKSVKIMMDKFVYPSKNSSWLFLNLATSC